MNRTMLIGRLTRDVELRKTQGNNPVVSFTLAVNRMRKQEGQPDTDFISCVAWNRVAELMDQYLHKGSLIGLEGRIQTRNYDDRDGKKVYVTEVIAENLYFLEKNEAKQKEQQQTQYQNYRPQNDKVNEFAYGSQYNDTNYRNQGFDSIQEDNPGYNWDSPLDIQPDDLPF